MANAIPDFASFSRALAGTPMAGEARAIYNAALHGGINPALVVGIAGAESGFGSKGYAVGRKNPYGLMGFSFPSYAAATTKLAQTLNSSGLGYPKAYAKSGLRGVIGIYTPWHAANGPGNNPDQHTQNIISIGNRTGGNASVVYTNGAAAPASTGAAAAAPGASAPRDYSSLLDLSRQQSENLRSGRGYDQGLANKFRAAIVDSIRSDVAGGGSSVAADAVAGSAASPGYPLGKKGSIIGTPYSGTHTLGNWESDNAVDIGVPVGTPVYAINSGTIGSQFGALNSNNPRMAGLRLHLQTPGNEYYYAHLSRFAPGIRPGISVTKGQLLGYSGSANGTPHLHLGEKSGNPLNYFAH